MTSEIRDALIAQAADRLESAARSGQPCSPVSNLLGNTDIDAAYRVQQELAARRVAAGRSRVGRKIGLTSEAVQQQIGVDRPDFGMLFDDMSFEDGELIPSQVLLQPRAEAEIAFVLGDDILDADDPVAVRAAVAYASPALEIVDSRIENWRIGITDTVADNASSGVFVIGASKVPLDGYDTVGAEMIMLRGNEQVSQGSGRDCLGDPLTALAWLARTALEVGDPLRAGEIVLSGALGPMVAVQPGEVFRARIGGLGDVTAQFSTREEGGQR